MFLHSNSFIGTRQGIFALMCLCQLIALSYVSHATLSTVSSGSNAPVTPEANEDPKKKADRLKADAERLSALALGLREIAQPLEDDVKEKENAVRDAATQVTEAERVFDEAKNEADNLLRLSDEEKKNPQATPESIKTAENAYNTAKATQNSKETAKTNAEELKKEAESELNRVKPGSVKPIADAEKAESKAWLASLKAKEALNDLLRVPVPVEIVPADVANMSICKAVCVKADQFPSKLVDGVFTEKAKTSFREFLLASKYTTKDIEDVMTACNDPEKAKCMKKNVVLWTVLGSVGCLCALGIIIIIIIYTRSSQR